MQTNLVNVMQLLIPVLGKEQAKIGKEIVQADFSGELAKQLGQPENGGGASAPLPAVAGGASGSDSGPKSDSALAGGTSQPAQAASPAAPAAAQAGLAPEPAATAPEAKGGSVQAPSAAPAKSRGSGRTAGPRTSKALSAARDDLYITNPVLAEKVLADLHLPAETIKACKNLQDSQGRISIGNFASLLATKQDPCRVSAEGKIGAETARQLLASIVRVESAQNSGGAPSGGAQGSAQGLPVNPGGYTMEGFKAFLDQVVQKSAAKALDAAAQRSAAVGEQATATAASGSSPGAGGAAGPNVSEVGAGQTERLAASAIPSFAEKAQNEGVESSSAQKAAEAIKPPAPEASKPQAPAPQVETQAPADAAAAQPVEPATQTTVRDLQDGQLTLSQLKAAAATAQPVEPATQTAVRDLQDGQLTLSQLKAAAATAQPVEPATQTTVRDLQDGRSALPRPEAAAAAADKTVPAQAAPRQVAESPSPKGVSASSSAQSLLASGGDQPVPLEVLSSPATRVIELSSTAEGQPATAGSVSQTAAKTPQLIQDLPVFQKESELKLAKADALSAAESHLAASGRSHDLASAPATGGSAGENSSAADSFRSLDLARQFQEGWRSGSGAQMTLEIDQEHLGPLTLRVGTRKQEVSVVAVTGDESAKALLVRNTADLRQNLEEQGLMLGRFLVDVQKEKPGNGKWQEEENTPRDNTSPVGGIEAVQAGATPPPVQMSGGNSLINLFA